MNIIEMEIWKPNPDHPGTVIFDKQRVAQDIFNELQAHLIADGRLPDDYFTFDEYRWENRALFPRDAEILCYVNYGDSEGIYLDVTVRYEKDVYEYDSGKSAGEWKKRMVTEGFATGKTLGDSIDDLDKMNLAAASVTAAFYGFHKQVRERYARIESGTEPPVYPLPSMIQEAAEIIAHDKTGQAIDVETKGEKYNELKEELMLRLGKNLDDYHESLQGFGKRELIEMAGKISAMSEAYSYMFWTHEFSEDELSFFLKFQTPLEILTDAWCERNESNDDFSFAMDHVLERRGDLLTEYPLTSAAAASVGNSQCRFMGVDLISFLGKISKKVNIPQPNRPDYFKTDINTLHKAAASHDPNEKKLIFRACSFGTFLEPEREVFTSGTSAYEMMASCFQDVPDTFGYVVEVTGKSGNTVMGNVFATGNYADFAKHIRDTAEPLESVTFFFSDDGGLNAGKAVTVSGKEYGSVCHRQMNDSGNVIECVYHPQDKWRLAGLIVSESSRRMSYPIGNQQAHLKMLGDTLAKIRKPPEQATSPSTAKPKQSITARLKEAGAEAQAYNAQRAKNNTNIKHRKDTDLS